MLLQLATRYWARRVVVSRDSWVSSLLGESIIWARLQFVHMWSKGVSVSSDQAQVLSHMGQRVFSCFYFGPSSNVFLRGSVVLSYIQWFDFWSDNFDFWSFLFFLSHISSESPNPFFLRISRFFLSAVSGTGICYVALWLSGTPAERQLLFSLSAFQTYVWYVRTTTRFRFLPFKNFVPGTFS